MENHSVEAARALMVEAARSCSVTQVQFPQPEEATRWLYTFQEYKHSQALETKKKLVCTGCPEALMVSVAATMDFYYEAKDMNTATYRDWIIFLWYYQYILRTCPDMGESRKTAKNIPQYESPLIEMKPDRYQADWHYSLGKSA